MLNLGLAGSFGVQILINLRKIYAVMLYQLELFVIITL